MGTEIDTYTCGRRSSEIWDFIRNANKKNTKLKIFNTQDWNKYFALLRKAHRQAFLSINESN